MESITILDLGIDSTLAVWILEEGIYFTNASAFDLIRVRLSRIGYKVTDGRERIRGLTIQQDDEFLLWGNATPARLEMPYGFPPSAYLMSKQPV